MNDDEVLARLVKEQLNNFVENHRQIIEDLRTIFNRIDEDGKKIVRLESELKSNAEKDKMRKESTDKAFGDLEDKIKRIEDKSIQKLEEKATDIKIEVASSLQAAKWIFGGLSVLSTIVVAIFTILQFVKH